MRLADAWMAVFVFGGVAAVAGGCSNVLGIHDLPEVSPGSGDAGGGDAGGDAGSHPAKLPEPLTNMAVLVDRSTGKVMVFGGTNAQQMPSKAVYAYDLASNSWTRLTDMPTARTALGAGQSSTVDAAYYVFGGFDVNNNGLKVIEAFDPETNQWSTAQPMPTARGAFAYVGLAAAGGAPTVNGGPVHTTETQQTTACPAEGCGSTPRWMPQANMPTARAWAAGAPAWGTAGSFLVLGGAPAQGVVERFDVAAYMWKPANSMPTGRGHLAAAAWNSTVVAVGGSNGTRVLDACEAYDVNMREWSQLAPMPTPREGLGAGVMNEASVLIAIGGDDGASPPKPLDTVEIYSFQTKTWWR